VALTNRQIERYSRQLIVPDFGGIAQERLLAARVLMLAGHPLVDSVLAYLVGAGVGHIDLSADLDPASSAAIIARMNDLNPDSTVRVVAESGGFAEFNLALVLANDEATLDRTRALCDHRTNVADSFEIILVRLDVPPRIAVFPRRPPCPRCASAGDLLAPINMRADNAGFVASLAALEALKLLARLTPASAPTLIEFRGYESSSRVLASTPGLNCSCDRP
jgi:molybdopterin/thiamine biosynthesis adenylyltransferase